VLPWICSTEFLEEVMEIYSTEEQQEEAIKKAIQDNWKVVVFGALLGLGGVWGWRAYDAHLIEQKSNASDAYEKIVTEIGKEGTDLAKSVEAFNAEHENKSYSVLLALQVAKAAVEKKDLAEAAKQLRWAADNAVDQGMKAVSLVRLARVQVELQKYDDALSILASDLPQSFTAQVEELKGDIYMAKGEKGKARVAYQTAADNDGLEGNNGLQYKIDNLAQATPAP
jgi:predicted negative regulator of RcsB-dependent stress response